MMGKRSRRRATQREDGTAPADATAPWRTEATELRTARSSSGLRELLPALKAAAIVLLVVFIYWPALHGDWLWDDQDLLARSTLVQDPEGWWKIWLQPWLMFDFMPLKITLDWVEWRFFGNDTLGYHIVSVVLHTAGALLLWRFFAHLGLRFAWAGALLFAVHPVNVESVAWISEIKNTLSLPFFVLAMTAWVDYEKRKRRGSYFLALAMFVVAMLGKTTMVMFPFVILLYAWWLRGRVRTSDLWAAAPFFAVSLAVGVAALNFLDATAGEQHVILGGPLSRVACAGLCLAFYFSKCVLPVGLLATYPQWPVDPPKLSDFLPWPVLAAVLGLLWTRRSAWGRHALLGLGFFLLNLLPFVGFTAASYMNFTWAMDHILYIPAIGLIGLAVAAAEHLRLLLPAPARQVGAALALALLGWMAWSSHQYACLYHDLRTFWAYNVEHNPASALAHNDLGTTYANEGNLTRALQEFRLSAQLDPRYVDGLHNVAAVLMNTGHPDEAAAILRRAVSIMPQLANLHYSLGNAYAVGRHPTEAIDEYRLALKIQPGYKDAYHNLKVLLREEDRDQEALDVVRAGLQTFPGDPQLEADLQDLQSNMRLPPFNR